jgi:glucose/mannose-6-phosphate isomerase
MYSLDKENYKKYLLSFPEQIRNSQKIFADNPVKIKKDSIKNIVYLGMGGSAIAGDIISDVLFDQLPIPIQVVRGYNLLAACSESTLVIASSYSGNTEETLQAVDEAKERGAQIVAITSGGEMQKLAKKHRWPVLPVPDGFPPRQAFGYLFFLALQTIMLVLKKGLSDADFRKIIYLSESIIHNNDEETAEGKVFAKDLAIRIKNKIPIVYSSSPYLTHVATRWKNQFQENSKSMAFSNVIPEMNHNEIVGWEMNHKSLDGYLVVFLEKQDENPKIKTRIQLTKNIIHDRGTHIVEVYTEGSTAIEQTVSLIVMSDWTSYYLALLYEKDPASIVNIDYLKGELKKHS